MCYITEPITGHAAYVIISSGHTVAMKSPLCRIQGDLFAEKEFSIHKYVFTSV